jgi:hypothetical protein
MMNNAPDDTLVDIFERAPKDNPFVTMWRPGRAPECETLTFGECLGLAARYRSLYHHEGLEPGDTVVLIMPQDIAVMAAFVGGRRDVFRRAAIHDGRAIAFGLDNPTLGTQDLIIVAEVTEESFLEQRGQIEIELRRGVLGEFGVAPRVVHLVPPKWVVKSTAGKSARSTNRRKLLREHPEFGYEPMGDVL